MLALWASALLLLALAAAQAPAPELCSANGVRVVCGTTATTQAGCEALGCCWDAAPVATLPWQPDVYQPTCFFTNTQSSFYRVDDPAALVNGLGNATLTQVNSTAPELGADISAAAVQIEAPGPDIVRIRVTDRGSTRFEVPASFFPPDSIAGGGNATTGASPRFQVNVTNEPFGVSVLRQDPANAAAPAVPTFQWPGSRFLFKEQFAEVRLVLNTNATLFGAGERTSATTYITRNSYPYTLWNRAESSEVPMRNLAGHWPFVLVLEADGTAWGVLLLNSNAQDVVVADTRLSWRTTGGVVDFYVFVGPTPAEVLEQYTRVVGRPAMQPYWAFGYHQGRYGYTSVDNLTDVVSSFANANMPLEAIWSDIDYMDFPYRMFTLSPYNFPFDKMKTFLSDLKAKNQSWVPVLTPGIKVDPDYQPYLEGLWYDAFLKDFEGNEYNAWTRSGGVNFPDFGWNSQAAVYWKEQLSRFNQLAEWDGLWLSQNEIMNVCDGEPSCDLPSPDAIVAQFGFPKTVCQLVCTDAQAAGLNVEQLRIMNPPYWVANGLTADSLGTETVSMVANHSGGVSEYDGHALYGMAQAKATFDAYAQLKSKRPFVLTRSTYVGTGAYAAHWTGDNNATWSDMQWSVPGVLTAGLIGFPMTGADICGFYGNTTEELCGRWIELGAWYPFARDSSDISTLQQEVISWPSVSSAASTALSMRYRLLPLYYTLMQASTQTGAPIMRPLWFEFPKDPATHLNSRQFMIGKGVMVAPALLENETTSVDAYFPQGLWYDMWDLTKTVDARNGGQTTSVALFPGKAPAYQLGSSTLVLQQPADSDFGSPLGAITTSTIKDSPLFVQIALPSFIVNQSSTANSNLTSPPAATDAVPAYGYLYNDDGGVSSVEAPNNCCNFLQFGTRITYDPASDVHSGVLIIAFGRPGDNSTDAQCQDTASPTVSYPGLRRIEVWGWQRQAVNGTLQVGTSTVTFGPEQMIADGQKLTFDFSTSEIVFQCPFSVTSGTITWQSPPPPPPPPPPPSPPPPPAPIGALSPAPLPSPPLVAPAPSGGNEAGGPSPEPELLGPAPAPGRR